MRCSITVFCIFIQNIYFALSWIVFPGSGSLLCQHSSKRNHHVLKNLKSSLNENNSFLAESDAPPPATFLQSIQQAFMAAQKALNDGFNLIEIEFPPLDADFLNDSSSSANDVSRANARLASQFGENFAALGKKVYVILPDEAELEQAVQFEGTDKLFKDVTLCTIRKNTIGSAKSFDQFIAGIFGGSSSDIKPIPDASMYIAIVYSCQELPDLEKLHQLDPFKPLVFFNLKIDSLRGDLGLPAFPPKSLHYEFLSKIKPVYLLRTRAYSKSLSKPPYLVNYQGAQFRVYPGYYQSLLDIGQGRYKQVSKSLRRPNLGDFKEIITSSLKLNEEENNVSSFFRRGFRNRTWWEDEKSWELEKSDNWRT